MKFRRISRRQFIFSAVLASPAVVVGDARWIEPQWVKIRRLRLSKQPAHRFVQFTDLHHKGDRAHTQSVVNTINALSPDFVCFTGDIIEQAKFLPEALEALAGIKTPLYGVPGNHDYWSGAPFPEIAKCFASTGGAWLLDEARMIAGGKINLIGVAQMRRSRPPVEGRGSVSRNPGHPDGSSVLAGEHPTTHPKNSTLNQATGADSTGELSPRAGVKNIVLMHYPAWAKSFDQTFNLMLAGHSHGGQVRIPFYGAVILPFLVDQYDLGLFHTKAGPLYVNPGIGWFPYPVRFNCRPEITVIEI